MRRTPPRGSVLAAAMGVHNDVALPRPSLVCKAVQGFGKKGGLVIGPLPCKAVGLCCPYLFARVRRMGPEHLSLDDQGHAKRSLAVTKNGSGRTTRLLLGF